MSLFNLIRLDKSKNNLLIRHSFGARSRDSYIVVKYSTETICGFYLKNLEFLKSNYFILFFSMLRPRYKVMACENAKDEFVEAIK